jgi:CPA2 family monovalent cation:H+ antiporter-2
VTHDIALIALIAAGLACALAGGLLVSLIGLPPLVGYLLAGVAIGPFTPGFTGDSGLAHQLAEIGIVLLMFGVGMHVSLSDLLAVRKVALPAALLTFGLANAALISIGLATGLPIGAAVMLGLCATMTSTVVLLRALESSGLMDQPIGRLAIGWLVVEDVITVLLLVALPTLAGPLGAPAELTGGGGPIVTTLAIAVGKVVAFAAVMFLVGGRVLPWLLRAVSATGSRDLFTLAVMVIALGIGFGTSEFLGLSHALGAFFAGIVVNGTDYSHRAQRETEPLQDIFAVLFFVSVGMVVDPGIFLRQPLEVLALLAAILFVKPLLALLSLRLLGQPWAAARVMAGGLAQIGEFAFMLAAMGVTLGLLKGVEQDVVLAAALLAITINPLVMRLARGRAA